MKNLTCLAFLASVVSVLETINCWLETKGFNREMIIISVCMIAITVISAILG